jgi:membrane protease YdiL (CAAX protease family)
MTPLGAIGLTAVIFTLGHVGVPHWSILALPLTLGLGMGVAVHWFGSIWVGVIAHAGWNSSMSVLGAVTDDPSSTFGTRDRVVLMPVSILLIGAGIAGWLLVARERAKRRKALTLEPAEVG